jgi:hypothetical protein
MIRLAPLALVAALVIASPAAAEKKVTAVLQGVFDADTPVTDYSKPDAAFTLKFTAPAFSSFLFYGESKYTYVLGGQTLASGTQQYENSPFGDVSFYFPTDVVNVGSAIAVANTPATIYKYGDYYDGYRLSPGTYQVFSGAGLQFASTGDSAILKDGASLVITAGVPEPESWALLIAGFGLTAAALRRRTNGAAMTA